MTLARCIWTLINWDDLMAFGLVGRISTQNKTGARDSLFVNLEQNKDENYKLNPNKECESRSREETSRHEGEYSLERLVFLRHLPRHYAPYECGR